MATKTPQKIELPEKVSEALYADFGSEANVQIGQEFDLGVGQLMKLTKLIGNVYRKEVLLKSLESNIEKEVGVKPEQAKKIAIQVCGKRLLIVDKEWFNGEVAQKISQLGGNPADYDEFVAQYQKAIIDEKQQKRTAELKEKEEGAGDDYIGKKFEEVPSVIKDPEAEKKSAKNGFSSYIKGVLQSNDFELKIELNVRLITLMLNDESQQFQRELLETLYNNQELLTAAKIDLKGEKADPTIGNWLKDYIHFAGVEEVVSTIKKAQYFTNSTNIKILSAEEKSLLDKLLDFYINLKNFYFNVRKYDLEEVAIFPFSPEEQEAFLKTLEREPVVAGNEAPQLETQKMMSIEELYGGKLEDQKMISEEKQKIVSQTRKEFNKVADLLEDYLLRRKRYGTIACLEILAETGALDNLIAKDARFKELLFGYFKRNNLQTEQTKFTADPYQAKYVQAFLKFVFLERLGLPENEGARVAANLSSVFRSKGNEKYAMLAYLDLSDNKFKWS